METCHGPEERRANKRALAAIPCRRAVPRALPDAASRGAQAFSAWNPENAASPRGLLPVRFPRCETAALGRHLAARAMNPAALLLLPSGVLPCRFTPAFRAMLRPSSVLLEHFLFENALLTRKRQPPQRGVHSGENRVFRLNATFDFHKKSKVICSKKTSRSSFF